MSGLVIRMTMKGIIPTRMISFLHPIFTPGMKLTARPEKTRIDNHSSKELQYRDIGTDGERLFHEAGASFSRADTGGGIDPSTSDSGMNEDESQGGERRSLLASIGKIRDISRYTHKSNPKKTGEDMKFNRPGGGTLPFPGILDHQDFRRASVSLGNVRISSYSDDVIRETVEAWAETKPELSGTTR